MGFIRTHVGTRSNIFSITLVASSFICLFNYGWAISCYTCNSWNNVVNSCHDPYHPANSTYTENCMVPKIGHVGLFPANFCLKIIGKKVSTKEELVIRACIMENMDNQCGAFKFQNDNFLGCILTCDYNGCNTGNPDKRVVVPLTTYISIILTIALQAFSII